MLYKKNGLRNLNLAFDAIGHDLVYAKLNAYRLSKHAFLTLVWVGFLEVRFEVKGGELPSLRKTR